jgi:hypothetical protein
VSVGTARAELTGKPLCRTLSGNDSGPLYFPLTDNVLWGLLIILLPAPGCVEL